MSKKNDKSISIKFVIFLAVSIIGIIIYCIQPVNKPEVKKLTFEEQLEKTNKQFVRKNTDTYQPEKKQIQIELPKQEERIITNIIQEETKRPSGDYKQDDSYKKLLEELKKYPSKSSMSANIVKEKLLKYLGYNEYTVKLQIKDITPAEKKPAGTVVVANFDIKTGNLNINQELISKLDIRALTSIIAHELDHFDKIAKICKHMGAENFFKFTEENNLEITNKEFWIKASQQADLTDFNTQLYQDALKRFIKQNQLEVISVYTDLYAISESIRNPLEVSAYELSDYILNYYNIKSKESSTKKLANQFNKVDWAIYNLTEKEKYLRKERIAFFDYILMKAIIENNKKYASIVNTCIKNNGDLSPFWETFKKDYSGIFNKNIQASEETCNEIISILNRMENIAEGGLSTEEKAEAVKLYIYKLKSNINYKNTQKHINDSIEEYFSYTKENKIENPKDTLQIDLILICMENNLNKQTSKEIPSLYYLKIPQILDNPNEPNKKSKKYNFIYKNPEFIKELTKRKQTDSNITEQKLLSEMILKTASEIK